MTTKNTITAIVPAAGVGSRMQHNAPKQYIKLAGKTILEHTLAKLSQLP
ncbi:2-C-methyl-D-erythritol 4-phosphate cytidylyltransferase, partial [Pseudoalteromonas ruthenica]